MVEERLSGPRDERCLISQDVRERQRLGGSKEMRGKEAAMVSMEREWGRELRRPGF